MADSRLGMVCIGWRPNEPLVVDREFDQALASANKADAGAG